MLRTPRRMLWNTVQMTAAQIAGWLSDNLWTFILLPIVVGVALYFTIRDEKQGEHAR